ncbi:hypothetical protein PGTUg99_021092 [Puccinia graminis f. sp. tritici]|uniref:Uncharacterized protein n=1 Tax=Puccinia graminis f. sp. tritici TaxID=56615 RepID=A0A5B0RSY9_PUCGR|nr:hypothetical protein PGTUg99_021092 [Puccinia graminis f. sp. tritici]
MGCQLVTALRESESTRSSDPFANRTQAIHVEATTFDPLGLNRLDQNFKKKERQRRLSNQIIRPIRTANCSPLVDCFLDRLRNIGVEANGFVSLQLDHSAQTNLEGLIVCVEAIKLASLSLNSLDQNFNKRKKPGSFSYESSKTGSNTIKQFISRNGSEHLPPSSLIGTQLQTIDVEASSLAWLAFNDSGQNFKKKKQQRWIRYEIILPIRTVEYTPSVRLLLDKAWTIAVRATSLVSLASYHLLRNVDRNQQVIRNQTGRGLSGLIVVVYLGDGNVKLGNWVFLSCSNSFGMIRQLASAGKTRAIGILNRVGQEAKRMADRKNSDHLRSGKRRTRNDWSELPTVDLGTQETGFPSIRIGGAVLYSDCKRKEDSNIYFWRWSVNHLKEQEDRAEPSLQIS